MSENAPACPALAAPLPADPRARALLVMLRRMAIHGIRDAQAAWLALRWFGAGFRKPLVLLRCYILELAEASRRTICIAPCCTPGMTRDELLLLGGLTAGDLAGLEALTDGGDVTRAHVTAQLFRRELAVPAARAG